MTAARPVAQLRSWRVAQSWRNSLHNARRAHEGTFPARHPDAPGVASLASTALELVKFPQDNRILYLELLCESFVTNEHQQFILRGGDPDDTAIVFNCPF